MKKSLFVAAAALVFAASAVPAHASHGGGMGLGLLHNDFPAGIFFGLNDQTTVHFGLGFDKFDVEDDSGDVSSQFGILAALEYDLWYGENWGFGVFPSLSYMAASREDFLGESVDGASDINFGLNLGGHFDPVSNVAVYFNHGLNINIFDPGEGDSSTEIGLDGWNLGEFGVAFWFK